MIRFVRVFLFGLLIATAATGQAVNADRSVAGRDARTETIDFESSLMRRKMPYRVVLPWSYSAAEASGRRYPVVYLLHGLGGHFDNWTVRTKLVGYTTPYDVIVVTPEGEDGWYTDDLSKDGRSYESYLVKELIPEIDKRYRTFGRREGRAIAGLSMGGYGAIKFGLKYPEMFAVVGSFSGALRAASMSEKDFPGVIGRSIVTVFGPLGDEMRKANDVFGLLQLASAEKLKKLPFVYLDCGTEDKFIQQNRDFSSLLFEKKVQHEFRQLPGGHEWKYWDKQAEEFLRVSSRFLH